MPKSVQSAHPRCHCKRQAVGCWPRDHVAVVVLQPPVSDASVARAWHSGHFAARHNPRYRRFADPVCGTSVVWNVLCNINCSNCIVYLFTTFGLFYFLNILLHCIWMRLTSIIKRVWWWWWVISPFFLIFAVLDVLFAVNSCLNRGFFTFIFPVCQHTDARYWYSKSVRLSVRLSVCPLRSGIRWKQLNISSQFFSPYGSPIILA